MVEHKKFLEGIWHELKDNCRNVKEWHGHTSIISDIEEHLGFFPCGECGNRFPDDLLTGKKITHRATRDTPEEYEDICEDCVALEPDPDEGRE